MVWRKWLPAVTGCCRTSGITGWKPAKPLFFLGVKVPLQPASSLIHINVQACQTIDLGISTQL
jgi:hypothetical protein